MEVKSLWRGPYLLARYLLLLVVVVMSCFLLDQAGDRHGWKKGVWVIPTVIMTACLPAWLIWKYQPTMRAYMRRSKLVPDSPTIFTVDIWMWIVDWLMGERGGRRGRGSYEILINKQQLLHRERDEKREEV
jgi:hypothetical protein